MTDAEGTDSIRRMSLTLSDEDDANLREVVRKLVEIRSGVVTWSTAIRAALRATAMGEELS